MTTATVSTEDRIRAAYRILAARPGTWVSLVDIRLWLQDLPREEQDRALRGLMRDPNVRIIPEENQKALTRGQRENAAWIGGQWKHYIGVW